MIYLHPSLGISNAPSTPPRITDPSYIDRIYEFVGVQKAQFSLVIEASNGTVLDDIKETRLTAHLFDADGRELTEHLTALSLYWEEHNETWTEVGRGWSYLVNDNSRFLRLLRVRVSQLDIMTALGLTIDAETKKTLAGIMVQQEVKITSSSYIYSRIPSVEALHDSLVNDVHFRELVKGAQGPQGKPGAAGAPGKDGKSVTAQEVVSAINTDSFRGSIRDALKGDATFVAATRGEKGERGVQGVQGKPGAAGAPGKDGKSVTAQEVVSAINTDSFRGSIRDALKGDATFVAATRGEKGERGAQGVQGKPGAAGAPGKDGKSVTAQEVVSAINTDSFRGSIRDALKGDATFVAATRGEKGERGAQGVQGKPGAAGAPGKDGKSVTAQEVVSAINTDSFRGSIRDALKGDATFVAATRGEKGERGVQGVQGKPGAAGAPGKDGKSVTAQEVVSAINTDSFRGSIRDALKGDATFVAATRGEKGERGAQGVQGKPGAAGAPGKDGKSVTAQEVVSAINTDSFRGSIRDALKGDATFVAATRGEKGERGAQGVQGKPGAAGAPGKDGKSVTAQEVVSAINTDSFRGSIRDALKGDATFVAATRGEKGERGVQGVQGKPGAAGAPGKDGKSVTAQEVVSAINTDSFRGSIRDALKGDATFVAATRGEKGERGAQGVQGKPGAAGAPGKDGKSVTAQEVADTINTADWQNQIASAAASNIIKTPILSDKLRELVQPDTTELIKRLSSRTMRQDILSQNGGKYLINVPAFALFEPEVEDGAAISLQVSIRQPIGSCTNPNNHDERGYFFIVKSWEPIYTTSAEKLCNKGGEIKVYYDSEQCAESLLSIKLERSNDHWVFVNYYDFAASIQADCTQIATQSHYSNKSQDEMLSYAPLQYLSGRKRNAVLPTGRVGIVIRVWANKWVGDVRVRTELGESLYNTSDSTGGNIGSDGALIPAGHIGEFICINEEKIWLYTDLSR